MHISLCTLRSGLVGRREKRRGEESLAGQVSNWPKGEGFVSLQSRPAGLQKKPRSTHLRKILPFWPTLLTVKCFGSFGAAGASRDVCWVFDRFKGPPRRSISRLSLGRSSEVAEVSLAMFDCMTRVFPPCVTALARRTVGVVAWRVTLPGALGLGSTAVGSSLGASDLGWMSPRVDCGDGMTNGRGGGHGAEGKAKQRKSRGDGSQQLESLLTGEQTPL